MEDLERLERERYGVFALAWIVALAIVTAFRRELVSSVPLAIGLGLLCSGLYVAWRATTEYYWALTTSEARARGANVTKRGVWLGNLFPGTAVVAGALYFLHR